MIAFETWRWRTYHSKCSGKSVNTSMRTGGPSVQDVDDHALLLAGRGGLHHRAQRVGDAPAPADHSAEVVIGHLDLEHDLAVDLLDLGHLDLVRILDQRPGEEVEQISHETPPARRLAAGGLDPLGAKQSRDRTSGLCALLEPVLGAILVDHDQRRIRLRVVLADRLDRAAVPRRALVGDDNPPDRVLLRADPAKSDSHGHAAAEVRGSTSSPA